MINEPLKIVMFPGGCSGHFMADWLTLNDELMRPAAFQIDNWKTGDSPIDVIKLPDPWYLEERFKLGMISDLSLLNDDEMEFLLNQIKRIPDRVSDVVYTHITDHDALSQLIPYSANYVIIWPHNNKFGWIKTAYHKNGVLDTSIIDPRIRLFEHLFNFISMYDQEFDKMKLRSSSSFDYANITNMEELVLLYRSINGFDPSESKILWAQKYIDQQFKAINECASLNYADLMDNVNPTDLFDLAVLVYQFEKNNPSLKRKWTIDDVPTDYNLALEFFEKNHLKYY